MRMLGMGPCRPGVLSAALLAAAFTSACEVPFDPFLENDIGPFSMYGYLDLNADVQWIRVTPIRQDLLASPDPIDAVVTLEHLGTGEVVTLEDSLFTFTDPQLNTVGYAYNFLTTAPLEPEATYRVTATRSDGATTTALVEMPPQLEATLEFWEVAPPLGSPPLNPPTWEPRILRIRAEHLLYAHLIALGPQGGQSSGSFLEAQDVRPGEWRAVVTSETSRRRPHNVGVRRELLMAVAGSDWPYEPGLSPRDVTIPGLVPTTVENGVGSVRGIATRTVPLPTCEPLGEDRAVGDELCVHRFEPTAASVAGRVIYQPCGEALERPLILLTERFPDGGAVVWKWRPNWEGDYRFEGLVPGSELRLEFFGMPEAAVAIPALEPGERHVVPDVTIPCGLPPATEHRARP